VYVASPSSPSPFQPDSPDVEEAATSLDKQRDARCSGGALECGERRQGVHKAVARMCGVSGRSLEVDDGNKALFPPNGSSRRSSPRRLVEGARSALLTTCHPYRPDSAHLPFLHHASHSTSPLFRPPLPLPYSPPHSRPLPACCSDSSRAGVSPRTRSHHRRPIQRPSTSRNASSSSRRCFASRSRSDGNSSSESRTSECARSRRAGAAGGSQCVSGERRHNSSGGRCEED
jgi:hypothetical protein